ncbi:MAG: ribosome silencing factor [Phycisphaerae bacterium]
MPEKAARAEEVRTFTTTGRAEPAAASRPQSVRESEAARQFAVACARIAASDHCEDIVLLDLRGVSPICDFFVIATGTSDRQMRATCDHIEAMAREDGQRPYGTGGYDDGTWIVADYVDVVVHLFDAERRDYYDLESLWGDRPHIDWAESP